MNIGDLVELDPENSKNIDPKNLKMGLKFGERYKVTGIKGSRVTLEGKPKGTYNLHRLKITKP